MKKYLLVQLFISLTVQLPAQSTFLFPTENAEWVVTRWTEFGTPFEWLEQWKYWVTGDILTVDSVKYTSVYARGTCFKNVVFDIVPHVPAEYALVGGLRQQGDSVFFRRMPTPVFTGAPPTLAYYPVNQEVLIYNFSLEEGDTLIFELLNKKLVADSIRIDPEGRKNIHLSMVGCGFPSDIIWLEGQGCNRGLLENICYSQPPVSCFYSESEGSSPCPLLCTPDDPVLVSTTPSFPPEAVKLYPNPTSGNLTLSIEAFQGPVHVEVVDVMGRVVHQQMIVNPMTELTLSNLAPGIYQVNLIGSSGRQWNSRLMVSH